MRRNNKIIVYAVVTMLAVAMMPGLVLAVSAWFKTNGELGVEHRITPMTLDTNDLPEYGTYEIPCPEGSESETGCTIVAERPNSAPPPGTKLPSDNDTDMKPNPYLTEVEQNREHMAQEAANARGDKALLDTTAILTYVKELMAE